MKIVSWNVNSVRRRTEYDDSALLRLLAREQPDVVCLQELQCRDKEMPRDKLRGAGYEALVCAQKGKNGVAILTHTSLGVPAPALRYPWPPVGAAPSVAAEARFCAADIRGVIVASVYVPYGRSIEAPQWQEKRAFFDALKTWSWDVVRQGQCLLLAGDFNVAPENADVHLDTALRRDAKLAHLWPAAWAPWCHSEMRQAFSELLAVGLVDLGAQSPATRGATLFDERNYGRDTPCGVRVDHFLASLPMAARLKSMAALADTRAWPRPSDHCPIVATFRDLHRVFATLTGSHLHGTSRPSSDIDIKGIVLPSPKDFFLGRGCTSEVVYRDKKRGEKNNAFDVDTHFFAPEEFVKLLVKGDNVAWEILFAPPSMLLPDTTPSGMRFVAALRCEVHQLVTLDVSATLGAVKQYTRRVEHEGALRADAAARTAVQARLNLPSSDAQSLSSEGKKLGHAVRVLKQAEELLLTHALVLPRPNAAHLRAIKENAQPLSETLEKIASRKDALARAVERSGARASAELAGAEGAVRELIAEHLGIVLPGTAIDERGPNSKAA